MGSKVLEKSDYRYGLGDKYGRRTCDSCGKYRRINAYWQNSNKVLCRECSLKGNTAFEYSVKGGSLKISLNEWLAPTNTTTKQKGI